MILSDNGHAEHHDCAAPERLVDRFDVTEILAPREERVSLQVDELARRE